MQTGKMMIVDFSVGEMGRELAGRIDLPQYQRGGAAIENCVVMPYGGLTKMPGSLYLGEIAENTNNRVLASFVYTVDESYILEFGHLYLNIWNAAGEKVQTITAPWNHQHLHMIQMAGIEWWRMIACRGYKPYELDYDPDTGVFSLDDNVTFSGVQFHTSDYYPAVVAFNQERLIFANTPSGPATVYASRTGIANRKDFTVSSPLVEADYWEHEIGNRDASEIIWIDAYGALIVATATEEFSLHGGATGLSPGNFEARPQSTYGSAPVRGRLLGDSVIFLQRNAKNIREYIYNDNNAPYIGSFLNILSPGICGPGIIQMAHTQDPYPIIWLLRKDGVIAACTRDRTIEIQGFHRHTTAGKYRSIASIPSGNTDQLWVVVEREGKTMIERFESFDPKPIEDGVFLHSAVIRDAEFREVELTITDTNPLTVSGGGLVDGTFIRVSGAVNAKELNNVFLLEESGAEFELQHSDGSGPIDASEWSWGEGEDGLAGTEVFSSILSEDDTLGHLLGFEVGILADGGIHAGAEVEESGGEYVVNLNRWASKVIIGLPYMAYAETMPGGLGTVNRMTKIAGRFLNTVGCLVGDDRESLREMLWLKTGEDLYLGPAPVYTGDKKDLFPGRTKNVESIAVGNNYPLPWTLLALAVDGARSSEV